MNWLLISLIVALAAVGNAQTSPERWDDVRVRIYNDARLIPETPTLLPTREACALLAGLILSGVPEKRATAVEALQRVPGWVQWFDNKLNEYCQPSKGDGPTKSVLVEDLIGVKREVVIRDRTEEEARAAGDGRSKALPLFKVLGYVPRVEAAVLALRQLDTHGPTFWSGNQQNGPLSAHALTAVKSIGDLGVRLEGAPYGKWKWEDWMPWWEANKARFEPLVTGVVATAEPPPPPPAAPAPTIPAASTPPPPPVSLTETTPPAVVESNIPWAAILGGFFFLCALGLLWWRSKSRQAP